MSYFRLTYEYLKFPDETLPKILKLKWPWWKILILSLLLRVCYALLLLVLMTFDSDESWLALLIVPVYFLISLGSLVYWVILKYVFRFFKIEVKVKTLFLIDLFVLSMGLMLVLPLLPVGWFSADAAMTLVSLIVLFLMYYLVLSVSIATQKSFGQVFLIMSLVSLVSSPDLRA